MDEHTGRLRQVRALLAADRRPHRPATDGLRRARGAGSRPGGATRLGMTGGVAASASCPMRTAGHEHDLP